MDKHIVITKDVHRAVKEVMAKESDEYDQSYSKIVNYLITLGVEKYNELAKTDIAIPFFDFDKYKRDRSKRGGGGDMLDNYIKQL